MSLVRHSSLKPSAPERKEPALSALPSERSVARRRRRGSHSTSCEAALVSVLASE